MKMKIYPSCASVCDYVVLMPFLVFHPYGRAVPCQTGWPAGTAFQLIGQAGRLVKPGRARPGQGCHQLLLGCCGLTRLLRWLWYSADSSLRTNRGPRAHIHAHTHGKDYSRGHTTKSVYLYLMWGQLGGHGHRAYCIYK